MISEGKYKARGVEGALVTSGQKGTPGVSVVIEIKEGDHAGERIRWDGWLTENTDQRTLESLRHLGWSTDRLDDLRGIDSRDVQIVVEHESNQEGKMFARVKWVNSLGGIREESKMQATAAKNIADRYAARARGLAVAAAKPAPANGRRAPDPIGDDDIPF